jgi:hypothetical protein
MPSITVINNTNTVINTTTTCAGINSSNHNLFSPGEFYVHNAVGIYDLNVRYHVGPSSLYQQNWEFLGQILGEIAIDAVSLGLMCVGIGEVIALGRAAAAANQGAQLMVKAGAIAARFAAQRGVVIFNQTVGTAFTLAGAAMTGRSIRASEMPADAQWTNISGYQDRVFVIEGGFETKDANASVLDVTFQPLTIRELEQDKFATMKRSHEIFELSHFGVPVWVDGKNEQFYIDDDGHHVYNPGGDEYYIDANNKRQKVTPNRLSRTTAYTSTTRGGAMTKNAAGTWAPPIYTHGDSTHVAPVEGFEVRDQPGYGLVNLRLLHGTNHVTTWVGDEMGPSNANSYSQRFAGKRISKVEVLEQGGYGITDLRFTTETGPASGWLAGNAEVDPKDRSKVLNGKVRTYDVPAGKVIVGVVGKEQPRYGLIDLELVLHDAPAQTTKAAA